jgi:hypothetical protein
VKIEAKIEERYLRIIGTGEIVKWKNFSEITQVYEVESRGGKVFTVQSNKVSQQVTAEEANQF